MEGFFGPTETFLSIGLPGLLAIELGVVAVSCVFRPVIIAVVVDINIRCLLIVHGLAIGVLRRFLVPAEQFVQCDVSHGLIFFFLLVLLITVVVSIAIVGFLFILIELSLDFALIV